MTHSLLTLRLSELFMSLCTRPVFRMLHRLIFFGQKPFQRSLAGAAGGSFHIFFPVSFPSVLDGGLSQRRSKIPTSAPIIRYGKPQHFARCENSFVFFPALQNGFLCLSGKPWHKYCIGNALVFCVFSKASVDSWNPLFSSSHHVVCENQCLVGTISAPPSER